MSGQPPDKRAALVRRALRCVEPVVTAYAKRYQGLADWDEVASQANLAVVQVVERYDEARDATFGAYVRSWARGFVRKFIKARTLEQKVDRAARQAAEPVRMMFRNDEAVRAGDPAVAHGALTEHAEDVACAAFAAGTEAARRAAAADQPDARYEQAEDMATLAKAMQELPHDERVIIEGFYFDGLCLIELLEVLGVSEGTVRRRYTRAKRRLKKALLRLGMSECPAPRGAPPYRPVLRGIQGGGGGKGRGGGPGRGGGKR